MTNRITRLGVALALSTGLAAPSPLWAVDPPKPAAPKAADPKPADPADAKPADTTPAPSTANDHGPSWAGYVVVSTVVTEVVSVNGSTITLRTKQATRSGSGKRAQTKYVDKDHTVGLLPESLVRAKTIPPKLGETGRPVTRSSDETIALKAPRGYPGWGATLADLTPGTVVEATLIRDKKIPAAKATESDLILKMAMIVGKDASFKAPAKK